jgi:fatty acid desaturase
MERIEILESGKTATAADYRRQMRPAAIEWPTVALIAACYGLWFAAGFLVWPTFPVAALVLLALTVTMQSSLVHEALHGHPTRNARLNEAMVFLPIGLSWPFRRFKALHMRHHADERLTDPFDDPESYYQALWKHKTMPAWLRGILRVNNTMAGRLFFGPWLSAIGLALGDIRLIRAGDRSVRLAWLLHLAGLAVVVPIVVYGFGMPFWIYVIAGVWPGLSIISIRTYAEHQWSEDPEGRTIIVEKSPLAFFFLNNNLHFVHHALPAVAWYKLPDLFRARRGTSGLQPIAVMSFPITARFSCAMLSGQRSRWCIPYFGRRPNAAERLNGRRGVMRRNPQPDRLCLPNEQIHRRPSHV